MYTGLKTWVRGKKEKKRAIEALLKTKSIRGQEGCDQWRVLSKGVCSPGTLTTSVPRNGVWIAFSGLYENFAGNIHGEL